MYDVEVSLVVLAARGARWMVDPFNMIFALLCGVLGFRRSLWLAPAGLAVLAAAGICAYVNHQRDSLGLTSVSFAYFCVGYALESLVFYGLGRAFSPRVARPSSNQTAGQSHSQTTRLE